MKKTPDAWRKDKREVQSLPQQRRNAVGEKGDMTHEQPHVSHYNRKKPQIPETLRK